MVWLAPVASAEADFVEQRDWEACEHELVRQDPDLLDPSRAETALG